MFNVLSSIMRKKKLGFIEKTSKTQNLNNSMKKSLLL